jgi:hypothetical protein
MKSHSDQC